MVQSDKVINSPNLILGFFQNIFKLISILIIPTLVAILSGVFFSVPGQTIEIYRALSILDIADPDFNERIQEITIGIVSIFCVVAVIAYTIRVCLRQEAWTKSIKSNVLISKVIYVYSTLLTTLPLYAVTYGLFRAQTDIPTPATKSAVVDALARILEFNKADKEDFIDLLILRADVLLDQNTNLFNGSIILLVLSLILVIYLFLIFFPHTVQQESQQKFDLLRIGLSIAAVFTVCGSVLVVQYAAPISELFGVIGVFSIFLICLILILLQLHIWSQSMKIPIIPLILIVAFIFTALDLNDNHILRTEQIALLDNSLANKENPLRASTAFKEWLNTREDKTFFEQKDKKYPIYIITAQGGGIYAAYHAASFLSAIQDRCASFSDHIFAISGVSGGSVGASIFASLLKKNLPKNTALYDNQKICKPIKELMKTPAKPSASIQTKFRDAVDLIFKKDLLTPLVTAALFPDFLQRFYFQPIRSFDRTKVFELSLERAAEDYFKSYRNFNASDINPLSDAYLNHWQVSGATPALIFNTTEVGSGRRRLISPFVFAEDRISFLPIWSKSDANNSYNATSKGQHILLSTAAVTSARFSWITPAGWFVEKKKKSKNSKSNSIIKKKIRLVDGGYFENSGVASALDLIEEIRITSKNNNLLDKIQLNLIIITSHPVEQKHYQGFGEIASPIRALLNAREARAPIMIEQAQRVLQNENRIKLQNDAHELSTSVRIVKLRELGYPLPLGWRLSDISRLLILAQNGDPDQCDLRGEKQSKDSFNFDADCVVKSIIDELGG